MGMHAAVESQSPVADPSWVAEAPRAVHRYLRCLRCPRDVAEDLVQEAMLAAVRTWRQQPPPLPWLLVTARNLWFAQSRRANRAVSMEQLQQLHDRAVEELGADGGDARVRALRACVQALPPRSQQALQLYYRDGLTRREVAARLGMGDEGVKSLLERVKAALKQCVQQRRTDDA